RHARGGVVVDHENVEHPILELGGEGRAAAVLFDAKGTPALVKTAARPTGGAFRRARAGRARSVSGRRAAHDRLAFRLGVASSLSRSLSDCGRGPVRSRSRAARGTGVDGNSRMKRLLYPLAGILVALVALGGLVLASALERRALGY